MIYNLKNLVLEDTAGYADVCALSAVWFPLIDLKISQSDPDIK